MSAKVTETDRQIASRFGYGCLAVLVAEARESGYRAAIDLLRPDFPDAVARLKENE